ncbi:site-specific integrase [Uliginosibacterium sp. sgz301328]|uniref:site-specific integrase n=1 Tax=Uliginosibacterium sp. sgz301328 TaxID=3243764 RepID=UPI00359E5E93
MANWDDGLAEAVGQLLAEGESANTTRSYRTALRYWGAWFALRFNSALELPVRPATVIQFIVDHAQRRTEDGLAHGLPDAVDEELVRMRYKAKAGPLSLSSIQHRIAVLSQLHRLHGLANPMDDVAVRQLLAKTRRAYANRGVRKDKKPALTHLPLQKLLATCDSSLKGKRDRALLLFAVSSGGRRRSEVTQATMERLERLSAGTYVYVMGQSKTDQAAQEDAGAFKPVVGDAGAALEAWLAASGVTEGAIFRRVRRGDVVAEALNPAAVRRIVIERAKLAGLHDEGYSAHSLRAGFMTEAGLRNIPLPEAMALSGHASLDVAMGYFRAGNVVTSGAARLFDQTSEHSQTADEAKPGS